MSVRCLCLLLNFVDCRASHAGFLVHSAHADSFFFVCWTADAVCRSDSSFTPQDDNEQDLGSPEALIPRGGESSEDKPFQPRFLLQEIIFAHSPYEGVCRNQLRLQANLLCRSDWLCLRGIAETERAIFPIRELGAYPRCSACVQSSSGESPSASVPAGLSASRRIRLAQGRQPLLRAIRVSTTQKRIFGRCVWMWTENCQKAAHQHDAFFSFRTFATHACGCTDSGAPGKESCQHLAKHQKCAHSGIHFASLNAGPLLARSISAQEPAAAGLQCRHQPNPEKWTHGCS